MTEQVPNEKEFMEILEPAKVGEQKLREMSEFATVMAERWQRKAEAKRVCLDQHL